MEGRGIVPLIFNLVTRLMSNLTPRQLYPREIIPVSNRRLGGPTAGLVIFGAEKNIFSLSELEPRTVLPVVWSLYRVRHSDPGGGGGESMRDLLPA
jgi:hypothetical protein